MDLLYFIKFPASFEFPAKHFSKLKSSSTFLLDLFSFGGKSNVGCSALKSKFPISDVCSSLNVTVCYELGDSLVILWGLMLRMLF